MTNLAEEEWERTKDMLCADCGHVKRQHSGMMGCYQCDDDDFCDTFVFRQEDEES